MPRQSPLTPQDAAICSRFREARLQAGFSAAELAKRIGVDSGRLRHYERQRTPVPFWIGVRIARETDRCERWLATGVPPIKAFIPIEPWILEVIPRRFTFAQGHKVIESKVNLTLRELAAVWRVSESGLEPHNFAGVASIGTSPLMAHRQYSKRALPFLATLMDRLPTPLAIKLNRDLDALRNRYLDKLEKHAAEFRKVVANDEAFNEAMERNGILERVAAVAGSSEPYSGIDESSAIRNSPRMPSHLYEQLIAKLRGLCEERGVAAAVARDLNVPKSRVSEWLSGAGAPTAAKTLELLAWVEAAEGKTKRPVRAETRTGQRTQKKHTANAKQSGPKGKT